MKKKSQVIEYACPRVFIIAKKHFMINKIILNIPHSDDYTDYLFMTAALTNHRVVPMLNPVQKEIKRQSDVNTLVLRCINVHKLPDEDDRIVKADPMSKTICVMSKYYLLEGGEIDHHRAEMTRASIEHAINNILMDPRNLREVFRQHLPLLWMKRKEIFANPQFFFAFSGRYGIGPDGYGEAPVGAILKAMEEDPKLFKVRLGGGCDCGEKPFLVDYDRVFESGASSTWLLYTWCPICHSRREIRAWDFKRAYSCDYRITQILEENDKGQGLSNLSLFDVIDALRDAR